MRETTRNSPKIAVSAIDDLLTNQAQGYIIDSHTYRKIEDSSS